MPVIIRRQLSGNYGVAEMDRMKTRRSIVGKSIRNSRYPDQGNEATGKMILIGAMGKATKKSADLPSAAVPRDCGIRDGRRM
jgi:hypothetical protein